MHYSPSARAVILAVALGMSLLGVAGLDNAGAPIAARHARATPMATPAADHGVEIHFLRYGPDPIEIAAGETVTWVNRDALPHTVTATSGDTPKSEALGLGDQYRQRFAAPGRYDYICLYHAQMHGTVIVREATASR